MFFNAFPFFALFPLFYCYMVWGEAFQAPPSPISKLVSDRPALYSRHCSGRGSDWHTKTRKPAAHVRPSTESQVDSGILYRLSLRGVHNPAYLPNFPLPPSPFFYFPPPISPLSLSRSIYLESVNFDLRAAALTAAAAAAGAERCAPGSAR